eukprot:CAMPEP_0198303830 /NCGR_PEP_ID=MMETSP1449-20131203/57091_1 /TAXON_ID=420275 /ORGANISM="Attheya septentrionalis, Strain CCMP2084" /LENGTH=395 /DNA_ID=CAMNT_0044006337 /DNA_START=77 /DNA_END=1264 /DNA_ORIENTATION=-
MAATNFMFQWDQHPSMVSRILLIMFVLDSIVMMRVNSLASVAVTKSSHKLRLMTYNIHAWRDASHKCNFDRLVTVIQDVQPDVLCLNEVLHPFCNNKNENDAMSPIFSDYYTLIQEGKGRDTPLGPSFLPTNVETESFLYQLANATGLQCCIEYAPATDQSFFGQGVSFGNAILSRVPLQHVKHFVLEPEEDDLTLGNQERSHVEARAFSAAVVSCFACDDPTHSMDLCICFTHLDHKSEELREKQVLQGLDQCKSLGETIPCVICGDLNTFQRSDCNSGSWNSILNLYQENQWPAPPEQSLVLGALKEHGFRDAHWDIIQTKHKNAKDDDDHNNNFPDPTSWTNRPLMRIDHVLYKSPSERIATNSLVPVSYRRINTDASDHFPVVVDFEGYTC